MHSIWCWSFLAGPPAANSWTRYGRTLSAIGGKHILAGDTSCSRAPNATAPRAFCMLGTSDRIWFFSCRKCAGITYQSTMGHRWDRSARRVEKLRARLQWGASGYRADQTARHARENVPANLGDACLSRGRCESRGRVTPENIDQISIVPICGGNAEIDLLALAVGHFVDEFNRVRANRPPVTQRSP